MISRGNKQPFVNHELKRALLHIDLMEGYDNFGIFSHIFPHRHVFNGKRSTDNTIYLSSGGFILVSHSSTLACAGILLFF